jgi:hypothetical protein
MRGCYIGYCRCRAQQRYRLMKAIEQNDQIAATPIQEVIAVFSIHTDVIRSLACPGARNITAYYIMLEPTRNANVMFQSMNPARITPYHRTAIVPI